MSWVGIRCPNGDKTVTKRLRLRQNVDECAAALIEGSSGGGPGGWCQRSKADFLFEYSQLESEMN